MSYQEKSYFTILGRISESSFKIKENVPESVEELIEIAQSGPGKTEDGKSLIVFKTTQGRQFARLEEWPKNLFLEILKS